ncbi:ATP-binding protein [Arhodomonas sp. AD133]|uniref:ATP-binding protein n=1 Tax=Arhodomonas sp. AD133 TaxID=3415009 RepID=UPI003EB9145F
MRWDTRWRIMVAVMVPTLCTAFALLLLLSREHLDHMRTALDRQVSLAAHEMREPAREALRSSDDERLQNLVERLVERDTVAAATVHDTRRGRWQAKSEPSSPLLSALGQAFIVVTAFQDFDPSPVTLPLSLVTGPDRSGQRLGELTLTPDPDWAYRQYAAVLLPPAALVGAMLVVAALLASVTASSIRAPLRRITRFAQRLEEGHLDARLRGGSEGELGELERAMNAMTSALRASREGLEDQVKQTTSELRQTLQAVEVQNVELDVARKRALEASKVKSEFLANVSHEIRTPINGIVGFADLLYHSPLTAEQRDYVDTIRESCSNLLTIINDILDFSKIEAGKLVVDSIAFDLRDCVEEVLSLLAPSAYGKGLELVHLVYADVPTELFGDPLRLRQVLTNLVHNAIKFTPAGQVVVRVMLEEDHGDRAEIRVSVTDTGIGLSAADRHKLFKAFSQADTSLTRRFGGTGLGLIISRKLVEQMGGTIELESEPGEGSTFSFTADLLKQRTGSTAEPATPLDGRRTLLADPDALTRLALRHQLEGWGMTVEESAPDALASRLGEGGWDFVVLGLGRRELNQRAAMPALASAQRHGTPVVVLASTVDRNELRDLYQAGAVVSLPRAVRRQTVFRELCRIVAPGEFTAPAPARLPGPTTTVKPSEPAAPPAPAGTTAREADNFNLLVVDDNEINRKLITTIAARNHVRVVEAVDGRSAVEACRHERFDVIFMDIHMPGMSGEEASRRIRELPTDGEPPRIIALTANAMRGERERLLQAGLDDCLIKPVTEEQILRAVRDPETATGQSEPTPAPDPEPDIALREMLVAELPEHRRRIREAFRTGDLETMRERVHRLHGAVSVCRLPELKAACAALEDILIEEDRVGVPAGMETLLRAIEATLDEDGTRHAGEGSG